MEKFLKEYWPYIVGTAAAIGAVITFGWDVFTYFDGKSEDQAGGPKPAMTANPITAEANPQGLVPATSGPTSESVEPTSPATQVVPGTPPASIVTATGGIAILGNVTDSDLRVDAQGE